MQNYYTLCIRALELHLQVGDKTSRMYTPLMTLVTLVVNKML